MAFKRVKSIKLSEYFKYQKNKMITYKITPHISVSNNSNNRMWRTLSQMYGIYDRMPSRVAKKGFKFTYREKDSIWYDVVFRKEKGQKSIEFYVTTTELWAKKFKDIIENYMKVTIEEADNTALQIPNNKNTSMYEVNLSRHDIFSLHTDNREQTSPISSILTATDDITTDGDFARLSINTETMNRKEWVKSGAYAQEKLMKNKIPKRAGITPAKIGKSIQFIVTYVFETIFSILEKTLDAVGNVFFSSDNKKDDEGISKELGEFKTNLVDEINATKTSNKTMQKINKPVWKTRVRIAANTSEKLRSDLIGNTIGSAFGELSGDNEFITVNIRGKKKKERIVNELNTHKLSKETKADADVSLLSNDELAKVSMQMPTSVVQERYEKEIENNQKIVTEIPSTFKNDKGLLIGHADEKGKDTPIYLPSYKKDEFFRGYVFAGEMGMGKDVALTNHIVEGSLNHNMSFVVVDQVNKEGREGMANGVRDSLPPDKVIDLDYSNDKYIPPLDLTEVVSKLGRKGASRFANELIDFFGDIGDKAQSKKILRTMAKASGGSLRLTKDLLESEELRRKRVKELKDQGLILLANELEQWTVPDSDDDKLEDKREKMQTKIEAKGVAIFNRLDDFFGDDTLNTIFSQDPHPDMNFEKWMKEGKVIILRVPDRNLSTVAVRTLVHWITLKTLMTRLLMSSEDQSNGTFIVYNEPQTYLDTGLSNLIARIATQGRKERLGALIAVQYFDQLGSLTDDLLGGGVNWILFRNGSDNLYKKLQSRLEPYIEIDQAMKTEKYHAINLMTFGGKPQNPFLVKMLPPSYERYEAHDNSFLTKRHGQMYGRDVEEVERMLVANF